MIDLPEKMMPFATENIRFKAAKGGRGSAKSWSFATILLLLGARKQINVLCVREIQKSISKSVHKLLKKQIKRMGLDWFYTVTLDAIRGNNGTEFTFEGLNGNLDNIKSIEGIDYCWVEEAEKISKESLKTLIPTIRREDKDDNGDVIWTSEIWFSWNPKDDKDPINKMFDAEDLDPEEFLVVEMNWRDNPWFPKVLDNERKRCKRLDIDLYMHVWEGQTEKNSHAQIFRGKIFVEDISKLKPKNGIYYHGLDFGFGPDPNTITRCFEDQEKNILYIDKASFLYQGDIDDLPEWYREEVPTSDEWPLYADCSDTGSIRYLKKCGLDIKSKGKERVKEGIKYLRGYDKIVIHETLYNMIEEGRLYKYKVDKVTEEVLPLIIDLFNHGWDAIRYSLVKKIKKGTVHGK